MTETRFAKGDRVTWYDRGKRYVGTVLLEVPAGVQIPEEHARLFPQREEMRPQKRLRYLVEADSVHNQRLYLPRVHWLELAAGA